MTVPPTARLLNREGRWRGFRWAGLELRPDGALQLEALPAGAAPAGIAALDDPEGLAGVAALPSGDHVFTDPRAGRLLVVDGCDATVRTSCLGGAGPGPDELDTPRGLELHRRRGALLVADTGNKRIVVLALPSLEPIETWGGDGFQAPQSLAVDAQGRTYVADPAAGRLEQLDVLGRPVPGFWEAVRAAGAFTPVAVAASGERVFAIDEDGHVHVLDGDGTGLDAWPTRLGRPLGLAVLGDTVFVGDNERRELLAFRIDGTPIGSAVGYAGPVAAVAPDGDVALLVHPGDGHAPVRLLARGGHRRRGALWGGPVRNPSSRSRPVHLIRAALAGVSLEAHVQLRLARGAAPAPPVDPDAEDPFADARWQELPVAPDVAETLVPGEPGDALWVGMTLTGEGRTSPVLSDVRIDFDHETALQHLPPLYQRDPSSRALLARWLTLFETLFDQERDAIERLPALFDAAAAPAGWLDWLAGWFALELPESWNEVRRRDAVAGAYERTARRGTAAGLRDELRAQAGVEAVVEDPIAQAAWWALAGDDPSEPEAATSVLGATTMLAAGEAQGAVAGTSAVLDGSYLVPQEAYAEPLFTDVAHQFTVRLYRGSRFSDDAVALARSVLDRERPAHTTYHLCVVEPCLRVGLQARVGVDTVVAGPAAAGRLGDAGGLRLGGPLRQHLGRTTRTGRMHLPETATMPERKDR